MDRQVTARPHPASAWLLCTAHLLMLCLPSFCIDAPNSNGQACLLAVALCAKKRRMHGISGALMACTVLGVADRLHLATCCRWWCSTTSTSTSWTTSTRRRWQTCSSAPCGPSSSGKTRCAIRCSSDLPAEASTEVQLPHRKTCQAATAAARLPPRSYLQRGCVAAASRLHMCERVSSAMQRLFLKVIICLIHPISDGPRRWRSTPASPRLAPSCSTSWRPPTCGA